jgi:hypothetical protein
VDDEFNKIELLIRNAIDSISKSPGTAQEQIAKDKSVISEEVIRAMKSFVFKALMHDDSVSLRRVIQFHQYSIIQLTDELTTIEEYDADAFYGSQAEILLLFLQSRFSEHFDLDAMLPEIHRKKSVATTKRLYGVVMAMLSVNQPDKTLIEIFTRPIEAFLVKAAPASFRQAEYAKELVAGLKGAIPVEPEGPVSEKIRSLLIHFNFNSEACFDYYIGYFTGQMTEADSVSDRLEKLAFSYKTINQIQVKPGLIYDSKARPLTDQLSDWLLQEMNYLERKVELALKGSLSEEPTLRKEFKLEFDMSVAQFAYFIRTFIEAGVIQNRNISELIRFLARFVKTKRSENIAYESFRMKYYNVEGSTKDSVKNILHTAIGYINSN